MKNRVFCVIGANFGDEGKGTVTDYICSGRSGMTLPDSKFVVVRFNGGAQAGHTVVLDDGTRHVFSHFGSGTLRNVPTYLTKKFIVNPIVFRQERDALLSTDRIPKIIIHRNCPVTTPWDIMINQAAEVARGSSRHGSCGLGIGETIERDLNGIKFTVGDILEGREALEKIFDYIQMTWSSVRLRELKVDYSDIPSFFDEKVRERFIYDCLQMVEAPGVTIVAEEDLQETVTEKFDSFVFEGAQGLALDMDYRYFPHVTRSKTGHTYFEEEVRLLGLDTTSHIFMIYVTRTYITRHGSGPIGPSPVEFNHNPFNDSFVDQTNVENKFQGAFRYAHLYLEDLASRIVVDTPKELKFTRVLFVTHVDQVASQITYYMHRDGVCKLTTSPINFFIHTLKELTKSKAVFFSSGKAAEDKYLYTIDSDITE